MPSSPVAGVSWASRQLAIRLPRLFTKPTRPPRRFILTACTIARTSAGTINKARLRETDAFGKDPAPFPGAKTPHAHGSTRHRPCRREFRFGGLCPRASEGQTPGAAGGCGNARNLASGAGNYSRKHHYRGSGRERLAGGAEAAHRQRASGRQRRLRTLRADGDDPLRLETGTTGAARDAVPSLERRHVEARGCDRFAGTAKRTAIGFGILRRRLAPKCRRLWGTIFVLGLLFLLDRLLRRNDPLESAVLAHGS